MTTNQVNGAILASKAKLLQLFRKRKSLQILATHCSFVAESREQSCPDWLLCPNGDDVPANLQCLCTGEVEKGVLDQPVLLLHITTV